MKTYLLSLILLITGQTLFATISPSISTVPYENLGGKIIISAQVNGKSGRFIFDTGAGPNVFSQSFAEKVGTGAIEKTKVTDSNGKATVIDQTIVDSIALSDRLFVNSKTLVADNMIFDCFQVDGILGIDMFKDMVLQLDGSTSSLSIAPDVEEFNTEGASVLPVSFMSSGEYLPYIKIDILTGAKVIPIEALLDLGFDGMIAFAHRDLELIKKKNKKLKTQASISSSSIGLGGMESQRQYRLTLDGMKIGEHQINGFTAVTTSNRTAMIGSELLNMGKIIVDLKEKAVYLLGEDGHDLLDPKSWPISPTVSDGKLIVGSIWDASLEENFEIGDQILKINDKDYATGVDLCSLITGKDPLLKGSQRAVISIKNRAGKIISFAMVKK